MFCNNERHDLENMPYGFPGDIDINITNQNANMNTLENTNTVSNMAMPAQTMMSMPMQYHAMQSPIIEPGQEKVIHKTFMHEVPHECMKSETFKAHIDTKRLIASCFFMK